MGMLSQSIARIAVRQQFVLKTNTLSPGTLDSVRSPTLRKFTCFEAAPAAGCSLAGPVQSLLQPFHTIGKSGIPALRVASHHAAGSVLKPTAQLCGAQERSFFPPPVAPLLKTGSKKIDFGETLLRKPLQFPVKTFRQPKHSRKATMASAAPEESPSAPESGGTCKGKVSISHNKVKWWYKHQAVVALIMSCKLGKIVVVGHVNICVSMFMRLSTTSVAKFEDLQLQDCKEVLHAIISVHESDSFTQISNISKTNLQKGRVVMQRKLASSFSRGHSGTCFQEDLHPSGHIVDQLKVYTQAQSLCKVHLGEASLKPSLSRRGHQLMRP
jgi:hypothetical protein